MNEKSARIRIAAIALLALAASAVVIRERFRSGITPPPATVRKTRTVGRVWGYEVISEYPHDADAYTQGLIYFDGFLFESTGRTGRSSVRKARLDTGAVVQQRAVNARDFGEGLTEWRSRLVQLTPRRRGSGPPWHFRTFFDDIKRHFGDNVGVTYDIASLEPQSTFMYSGDVWGLTHDDHRLIMSDGSSTLRFFDPETFVELGGVEVFDGDNPINNLNELEFVDGKVYANVLPQDRIALIQPHTGQITGWIDLAELKSRMPPLSSEPLHPVMNGIAYDASRGSLFVTGKLWPKVFEIRVPLQ